YLITGVGTGGHITGCAQVLKKEFPGLQVFAVEPALSPVLSGGDPGPHPIQGIGAGFIPGILDRDILDGIIQVTKEDAFTFAKRCAKEEGILVGISSGASLAAVSQKIKDIPSGSQVLLTFCYDTGERYLSIEDLF
ncbi:MAG: cysteine synthase, partial [Nitrospira bacterium SG8_35_1]